MVRAVRVGRRESGRHRGGNHGCEESSGRAHGARASLKFLGIDAVSP